MGERRGVRVSAARDSPAAYAHRALSERHFGPSFDQSSVRRLNAPGHGDSRSGSVGAAERAAVLACDVLRVGQSADADGERGGHGRPEVEGLRRHGVVSQNRCRFGRAEVTPSSVRWWYLGLRCGRRRRGRFGRGHVARGFRGPPLGDLGLLGALGLGPSLGGGFDVRAEDRGLPRLTAVSVLRHGVTAVRGEPRRCRGQRCR